MGKSEWWAAWLVPHARYFKQLCLSMRGGENWRSFFVTGSERLAMFVPWVVSGGSAKGLLFMADNK